MFKTRTKVVHEDISQGFQKNRKYESKKATQPLSIKVVLFDLSCTYRSHSSLLKMSVFHNVSIHTSFSYIGDMILSIDLIAVFVCSLQKISKGRKKFRN